MNFNSEFELSRIYARGWNAAKALLGSASSELSAVEIEKLNPHKIGAERDRWNQGFAQALCEGPPPAKRYKAVTSQKIGAAGERKKVR
jgi:hypothetical protein